MQDLLGLINKGEVVTREELQLVPADNVAGGLLKEVEVPVLLGVLAPPLVRQAL